MYRSGGIIRNLATMRQAADKSSFVTNDRASDACAEVGKPLGQCQCTQLSYKFSGTLVMASSCRTDLSFSCTTNSM